jgi:hypothetical protein
MSTSAPARVVNAMQTLGYRPNGARGDPDAGIVDAPLACDGLEVTVFAVAA